MKKSLIIIAAFSMITVTGFAQTQRMNRTNSRSHYPSDTTRQPASRMEITTDADRNNPPPANTQQTNTPTPANNNNQPTNKPNNNKK